MKKVSYALLSIIMLFSVLSLSVSAADTEQIFTSGDYSYSILKDGSVEIKKYNGTAEVLNIPSKIEKRTVSVIGNRAFSLNQTVKKVTIPGTVKTIGPGAFFLNNSIENVIMKQGVQTIKQYAFSGCSKLKSIVIPDSVTTIKYEAFWYSTVLTDITIGNSIQHIGYHAFTDTGYTRDKNNYDEDKNLYLGKYLIRAKNSNGDIRIKEGTTLIAEGALEEAIGKSLLTSVYIPDSITEIPARAFWGCSGLKEVRLPKGIESIGADAFYQCRSLESFEIPAETKSIGQSAFAYCTSLSKITISNKVKTIGFEAFMGCTNLKSVLLPENVEKIEKLALGYNGSFQYPEKIEGFTIKGFIGTAAEKYATENKMNFQLVAPAKLGITQKLVSPALTSSAIKLTWKPVTGATGYRVYVYNTKTKKYTKLADTSATSYTVKKLNPGTTYKFAVKAYCVAEGKVMWSTGYKSLSTSTRPGTPTLSAAAGTKKATLKWNKQTGVTGYVVYMATSKTGKYSKIATLKGNSAVSYTKTGLTKGRTYYFKVAAYKTVGSSNLYGSFSAVKAVKVK